MKIITSIIVGGFILSCVPKGNPLKDVRIKKLESINETARRMISEIDNAINELIKRYGLKGEYGR